MKHQQIRYLGDAPGQAETVRIAGMVFTRGETYRVPGALARELLARGGFERVTTRETTEEE